MERERERKPLICLCIPHYMYVHNVCGQSERLNLLSHTAITTATTTIPATTATTISLTKLRVWWEKEQN